MGTFLNWVNVASPGFKPDLFTLYGWLSAELFAQALKNAGANPSRGSLLQALSKITSFNGDNIIAANNPVGQDASATATCSARWSTASSSGSTTRRSTAAPTGTVATTVRDAAGS